MSTETQKQKEGRITSVIGAVIDASFVPENMPQIYNALVIDSTNEAGDRIRCTAEVRQLLGDNKVRAVGLSATEGLMRGMKVTDTGSPVSVPVGKETLGRVFNVLGEPVDELGDVQQNTESLPIHRRAPGFIELDTRLAIFETGIKVIDLLEIGRASCRERV